MAVKKPGLRAKAAKNGTGKGLLHKAGAGSVYHENPMLKLSKTSKKEKQRNKSESFSQRLQRTAQNRVKKSTHKTRNDELRPDMSELLQMLPESVNVVGSEAKSWGTLQDHNYLPDKPMYAQDKPAYVQGRAKAVHVPNPRKSSGHRQILREEHENFNKVLANESFKASPFSTLKAVIEANLKAREQ